MWKIGSFVLLIVLACRPTNGHVEDLLFENGAAQDWEVNDIWDDQQKTENDPPSKLLKTLCEQYDLPYRSQIIDCNQLQIISKPLNVEYHHLKKREADEVDEGVEGSGDEPPTVLREDQPIPNLPESDESPKETEPVKAEEQPAAETPKEVEENKLESEGKTSVEAGVLPAGQEQPTTARDTPIPGVEPLQTTSAEVEKPLEAEESKTDETKPEENKTQETGAKPDETKSEEPKTEGPDAKPEEPKPDDSESKKEEPKEAVEVPAAEGGQMELSEAGKGQESDAKRGRKLTQEDLNNHQSGNALVNSNGNMIETDKKVSRMQPNESIKVSGEEPKSGAASEGAVRKDNKLLIGLFVAILVVGVAALSYNVIKKKRSKAAAARSEQNAPSRRADPEEGREMKPLMKTPEQKNNIEFTDEK